MASDGFEDFDQEESKKDEQIAELQSELERCRDGRNEDRFMAGLIVLILFDVLAFSSMDGWGGPIAILVLEIFLIIPLAKRFGVDVVELWIDKVLGSLGNNSDR